MHELTAKEMFAARDANEGAAATVLGQMLFEFARLDTALGLCLVWSQRGSDVDSLTIKVAAMTFHKKLDFLRQVIELHTQEVKMHAAYSQWIERADQARLMRNDLVHGRWGVEAYGLHVINVVGLPTSSEQRATPYTLRQLERFLDDMKMLQIDLNRLRSRWPL